MSQKPQEEKVSSGTQWHEQGFRTPVATRNMSPQEIKDFCVVLSHSYKCAPQDISFDYRRVEGEGDISDDDVVMLIFIHTFIHFDEETGIQMPKKRIIQRFLQTVPNSTKEEVAKKRQNASRRPQRRPVNSGIPSFEDFQVQPSNNNGIVPTKRLCIKK